MVYVRMLQPKILCDKFYVESNTFLYCLIDVLNRIMTLNDNLGKIDQPDLMCD